MERLAHAATSGRILGDLAIDRVVEREAPEFPITQLLPEATPDNLAPHRHWLEPRAVEPGTDRIVLPVQSYVVRSRHHTILIDSCVGDGKDNAFHPPWHRRAGGRFLADLAGLGVAPEAVDFVLCTHLHSGHVGVHLESRGARAVMCGDIMHSPVQCPTPNGAPPATSTPTEPWPPAAPFSTATARPTPW